MGALYRQRLKVVWAVGVELLSERGCGGSLGFKLLGLLLFGLVCGMKEMKHQADYFKILPHFQRPIRAGMLHSEIYYHIDTARLTSITSDN